MLQLLRKYQKVIFIVVTVTVILSFSFFGTYTAVTSGPQKEKDREIGKSLSGSAVYAREINELVRFLRTDALDAQVVEGRSFINLFNDGVVKKDIFETGLGLMLLQHYYPVLEEDLGGRLKKFAHFRPYAHPEAPFLSLEAVWKQFTPELWEHYKQFQTVEGAGREKLEALVALYLDQQTFPPSAARRLLFYLTQQYRQMVSLDPYLQSGEIAIFHAKTVEDWFGPRFVEVLAHLIHNAAIYAEKNGYRVSREEAKASLMKIGMEHAKVVNGGQMMTSADFTKHYARTLQALQMEEGAAIALWQKVLLFRRLFNDVGHSVFLDPTLYEQFHRFAGQGAHVDVYTLPASLGLHTDKDLRKMQVYLQAVGSGKASPLGVPSAFKASDEVMKKFPELVQKRFLVKCASVRKEDVIGGISLRHLMNWELEEKNFAHLQKKFVELAGVKEKEARYEVLEGLAPEKRQEVDRYAMEMIVEERPDLIKEALALKREEIKEIAAPYQGRYKPLPGIVNGRELLTRLEAKEGLEYYSQDGEVFYTITVLESTEVAEVMTFQEAADRGVLDTLIEKEAETMFVGALEGMKKALAKEGIAVSEEEELAKYRFYHYLQEEKDRLQKGGEYQPPAPVLSSKTTLAKRLPLEYQFRLEKRDEEYVRKGSHRMLDSEILKMEVGQWSPVVTKGQEGPFFFQVRERIMDEKAMQQGIKAGKEMLSNEAKRYLLSKLLNEMDAKQVVVVIP